MLTSAELALDRRLELEELYDLAGLTDLERQILRCHYRLGFSAPETAEYLAVVYRYPLYKPGTIGYRLREAVRKLAYAARHGRAATNRRELPHVEVGHNNTRADCWKADTAELRQQVPYLGVTRAPLKKRKPWLAQIARDGHLLYLGHYTNPRDAALAYLRASTYHAVTGRLKRI